MNRYFDELSCITEYSDKIKYLKNKDNIIWYDVPNILSLFQYDYQKLEVFNILIKKVKEEIPIMFILLTLDSMGFEANKINILKILAPKLVRIECSELLLILNLFSFEQHKLDVIKIINCKIVDAIDNISQLLSLFTFNIFKIELFLNLDLETIPKSTICDILYSITDDIYRFLFIEVISDQINKDDVDFIVDAIDNEQYKTDIINVIFDKPSQTSFMFLLDNRSKSKENDVKNIEHKFGYDRFKDDVFEYRYQQFKEQNPSFKERHNNQHKSKENAVENIIIDSFEDNFYEDIKTDDNFKNEVFEYEYARFKENNLYQGMAKLII